MTPTPDVKAALATFEQRMKDIGGCSDGYCCVTGKANGMHTNGGCYCYKAPITAHRAMRAGRQLAAALASLVGKE